MSEKVNQPTTRARRGFLKGALLAGGAAAATGTATAAEVLADESEETMKKQPDTTAKYRETAHVKKHYELTRF